MKDYTIEWDDEYNWYSVYSFGVYPKSSVLSGQTMKSYITSFDTLDEAQDSYPDATLGYRDAHNTLDHLPHDEGDDADELLQKRRR